MLDYKIEVKSWMLKKSSDTFTFMKDRNNDIPMPLMVMYGTKIGEAPKMIKVKLHGDIRQQITTRCMCCGRPITNKISQYFGIGPKCGGHNYVNPFDSEEELNAAVSSYREKLVNTTWVGWIPYSAIVSIDDDIAVIDKAKEMPYEITPESEYLFGKKSEDYSDDRPTIKARIDKPIGGTDDYSVFLSFRYNEDVKDAIKSLRVHIWNNDAKEWEIEYREFEALQKALPEFKFEIKNSEILPKRVEISEDYSFKTNPMSHQIRGIQYGLDHNRWLLADDQGLGKTFQVINLACIRKQTLGFKHCLIICGVNSLKWNWLEEIEKHSNETGWILGMHQKGSGAKLWSIGSNKDKLADLDKLGNDTHLDSHYFIITNAESLRDVAIADKLAELCNTGIINMVAIDEIHRLRNLNTQFGQGMLKLQPKYRVGMTGTPLMNSPLDLFAILKWLGYQRYSFTSFRNHFCNFDMWGGISSYKNIDQLRDQLDSVMLRRTKDEVLDLPGKVYVNEYVELTDEQKQLYNQAIADAMYSEDDDNDCILATLLRLRQISGGIGPYSTIKKNPKLDRLEQIVEEAVYSGTKVIVYSNWVEGIKPIVERLQKYNPVVLTGETKDADRQMIVNQFQNDDTVKVICGTIGALGTGVTLVAATEVVFYDEPWNDATKEQACDRAYRIGTTSKVTIHTIMSHNTYDEDVHAIVEGKRDLAERIVEKKDLLKLKIVG